ncbi:hypothetical protein [Victivallis vadensis]|uniref:hypothetical protein n=1 Tax=Victivallis vadensis TaxID=172901 RepID=UPI00266C594A|nr:hypothetical protein [Victivallis vadensis]
MNIDDERDPELDVEQEREPDRHWLRPYLLILLAVAVLALFVRPALSGAGEGGSGTGGGAAGTGSGAGQEGAAAGSGAGQEGAAAGSGGGDGDGAAATGAAERGTGSGGEASVIPETASPAAASAASAAASAPALQWESDRPATDTEERVYRLACLYLGNAVADGGKIRFPAFGAPGTSIRKAEKGYEVAGFFRIEGKDGRFVDYRYTLTVDEHIVSVLNSSTTRMEAKP